MIAVFLHVLNNPHLYRAALQDGELVIDLHPDGGGER